MIPWPHGPFRVSWRANAPMALLRMVAIGGASCLLLVTAAAAPDAWRTGDRDALATGLGFGRTDPALAVEALTCRNRNRGETVSMRRLLCTALIRDRGVAVAVQVQVMRRGLTRDAVSAVRLGGRPALVLPRGEAALLRIDALLWIGALLLIATLLAKAAAARWSPWAPLRPPPPGSRIIGIDLLDRQLLDRSSARWRFAYDHDGCRHYGADVICRAPLLPCGVVSRGAGVLLPDGRVRMLTRGFAPLAIPAAVRAAAEAEIARRFDAGRSAPGTGLEDLLAALPPGAQRDYVAAWRDAWTGRSVAAVEAALECRHRAGSRLCRTVVDRLQQRCRSLVPGAA